MDHNPVQFNYTNLQIILDIQWFVMSNKTGFKVIFFNKINNFDENICIEENIILYVKM